MNPTGESGQLHPFTNSLLFPIAAAILLGGLLLITSLFIIRITKSRRVKRTDRMKERFQRILNKIIVQETFSPDRALSASFEFYLAELRLELSDSRASREVLIRQIIDIKKSLTGASAWLLIATYMELGLYKDSLRKLSARAWQQKALGIRELAEMQCRPVSKRLVPFLNSRNEVLRQESFMALVKLEGTTLSFLGSYRGELTQWMQINIYHHLSRVDIRKLPKFRQWFHVPNTSIRCFSITMACQFRQMNAIPDLVSLLGDKDPVIVTQAVVALGELEAFEQSAYIISVVRKHRECESIVTACLRCLARIGDPEEAGAVIAEFLGHREYNIRYEAVAALKKLGPAGDLQLISARGNSEAGFAALEKHLSDPLISN